MEGMKMFTPIKVGSLVLPNRIMMSPMFSNTATRDGFVTDNTVNHYIARARSRPGLIMVEHTSVNSRYLHPGNRLLISDDRYLPGLSRLAVAVKGAGSLVGLQIAHSIYAAGKKPADLSKDEVYQIINDFSEAALRCKKAGFDALEIHMAHTYTLADFISRRTNRRIDEFGKSVEGRFRIIREIVAGVRQAVGKEYTIFARFSADEFIIGGNSLKQTGYYARELEKMGIDCLDVSAGVRFDDGGLRGYSDLRGKPGIEMNDGPNVHLAEEIKKLVNIPVITVGKLGNPSFAEQVLQENRADMIALARQLIADPMWVEKVRQGRWDLIHHCRYCNNCLYKRRGPDDPVACLDVRKCATCLTCLRICPFDVPYINEEGRLEFENEWCEECGFCAGICPARLVRFAEWPLENMSQKIDKALEQIDAGKPKKIVFSCNTDPFAGLIAQKLPENWSLVKTQCISRLETLHLLEAIRKGADSVLVIGCSEAEKQRCSLHDRGSLIEKRVQKAVALLKEAGVNKKVSFLKIEKTEEFDIKAI